MKYDLFAYFDERKGGYVMSGISEIEKHAKQNSKLGTQNPKTHDAKPKTLDPKPETLLLVGPDFFSVSRFEFPVSSKSTK